MLQDQTGSQCQESCLDVTSKSQLKKVFEHIVPSSTMHIINLWTDRLFSRSETQETDYRQPKLSRKQGSPRDGWGSECLRKATSMATCLIAPTPFSHCCGPSCTCVEKSSDYRNEFRRNLMMRFLWQLESHHLTEADIVGQIHWNGVGRAISSTQGTGASTTICFIPRFTLHTHTKRVQVKCKGKKE
jgi:hypothetical protein